MLDKNYNHSLCSTFPTSTSEMPASSSNQESTKDNTPGALDDRNNSKEPKIQPSSILKKDAKLARRKEIGVHFPEDLVSMKVYDISDEEDSDSDSDTVILSDTEEKITRDQRVPSSNLYKFCSLFQNDDDCIPDFPSSNAPDVDFKPQFSFPPAIKIANLQLLNSPNKEEQMLDSMEINEENSSVVENVPVLMKTECENEACGFVDTLTTTCPSKNLNSEKISVREEPFEMQQFKTRVVENHSGGCEGSPGGDVNAINCDMVEMNAGTSFNVEKLPCSKELPECISVKNDEKITDKESLKEHEDRENKTHVARGSDPVPITTSKPDQTVFLGSCGSRLRWRGSRVMGTMLIDEVGRRWWASAHDYLLFTGSKIKIPVYRNDRNVSLR